MRKDKPTAMKLRKAGFSYGMIQQKTGISKSTLSNWLKDIPYQPSKDVRDRIERGQGAIGIRRRAQRLEEIESLRLAGINEIGAMSKRDLWMLGLGLWIGEGSKTIEQIRLVNSDPTVIKLFMRWLREICELEDNNITLAMHLYPDSDERTSMAYWMGVTGLTSVQFRKTQIDKRLDKRSAKIGKLMHGTLHITVVSNGDPSKGVRLYRRMMGWIAGVRQNNFGASEESRTPVT